MKNKSIVLAIVASCIVIPVFAASFIPPLVKSITRSQWGNSEYFKPGESEYWYPDYHPIQHIVIHHSAGGDGGNDPAATMRGIYQFHAKTRGWGDIGYNYAVDHLGNIYEGRAGGDNVEGGHTLHYNKRSLGVVVLGDYTRTELSSPAFDALVRLLANKVEQYGLDPLGSAEIVSDDGTTTHSDFVIAGHQDWRSTSCPGANIEKKLPDIRKAVAALVKIPASNKLVGKFYNNRDFSGMAVTAQLYNADLDFSPGSSSPESGVQKDNYSVRWDGTFSLTSRGVYTFSLAHTHQARVWVDGMLVVDGWTHTSSTNQSLSGQLYLAEGIHNLHVDFSKSTGTASLEIRWTKQSIQNGQYWVEWFTNPAISGLPSKVVVSNTLGGDWGTSIPYAGIPKDNFSVRYRGQQTFTGTDYYTFSIQGDDYASLSVDGKKVVSAGKDDGTVLGVSYITSGEHEVMLEEVNGSGGARAVPHWEKGKTILSPTPKVPIPTPDDEEYSPTPQSSGNITAEFFNNTTLTGSPQKTTQVTTINEDWGTSAPFAGFPVDNYSVRFTQKLTVSEAGRYRFTSRSDDGVRLRVDDQVIIDKWIPQGPTTYTADVLLQTGVYTVVLDYLELGGASSVSLNTTVIPTGSFVGEFFSNKDLAGIPVATVVTKTIQYNWGEGSPVANVPTDNFSARFVGDTILDQDEVLIATLKSDDGARLFIDGAVIIDHWPPQKLASYQVPVTLKKGIHHIVVEYNEWGGGAVLEYSLEPTKTGMYFVDYFANTNLAGKPVLSTVYEGALDFDWGDGSPGIQVPKDNFSMRLQGRITISEVGNYNFSALSDDGVRVTVAGQTIIDHWPPQMIATNTGVIRLVTGEYPIILEFNEWSGKARAKLTWERVDDGDYFVGEFFDNTSLAGLPKLTTVSDKLDYAWGLDGPEGLGIDNFSARWKKALYLPSEQTVTFTTTTDDGVRLWVDSKLIIDKWYEQPALTYTATTKISAGAHTLTMEYFEKAGGATAKLSFSTIATPVPGTTTPLGATPTSMPTVDGSEPIMRVGITSVAVGTAVTVLATSPAQIQSGGSTLTTLASRQEVSVSYANGTYTVKAGGVTKTATKPVQIVPDNQGILQVTSYNAPNWRFGTPNYDPERDNYNRFRGTIEVVYSSASSAVWVVNALPIEQYVWGSGEPTNTLPYEYLKMFSMLYRSYAKAYMEKGGKRTGEPFYLVNTSADQIYEGYNRELLTNNYVTAAKETRGKVLTYSGKTIITPYFSKSLGVTTLDAQDVWSRTDLPWCKPAIDPYGDDEGVPDCFGKGCPNHGVGLSAAGARGYIAKEGKSGEWVLQHYYTGVAVTALW